MSGTEILGQFIELLKTGPNFVETIYKDLAQPGVKQVGLALETILGFGNTVLFPFRLANCYTNETFVRNMEKYKEKMKEVPVDKVFQVPPEIGVPLLERLSYATNEDISELFVNLLHKASSSDTIHQAQPSFLRIIDSLSADEARIINYFNTYPSNFIPSITYRANSRSGPGYLEVLYKLTGIEKKIVLLYPQNIDFYLDNLLSLGILTYTESSYLTNTNLYSEINKLYEEEIKEAKEAVKESDQYLPVLEEKNIFYEITDLGFRFMEACTINLVEQEKT